MPRFDNAKDLFKWLASDELTKEEIIGMLTEGMCAELIVNKNALYLEKNGGNYDYHYDGEVVGTFKAPKIVFERLETLLYNAISCLEEYGCDGAQLEADIGITEEEYNALFNDDVEVDKSHFSYRVSFDCIVNGEKKDFEIGVGGRAEAKPDAQWTADKIRLHLSAFCSGDELLKAIDSIDNIELIVEHNGKYFDRDEAEQDVVNNIVALAKAPLLKPSLEGQVQEAEMFRQQLSSSIKAPVEQNFEL